MQPDLFAADRDDFDVRVPAQRHSRTSARAAERLRTTGVQRTKIQRLMVAYFAAGKRGCTDSEIHQLTKVERHSICSLRAHAKKHCWIVATGEREGAYHGFDQTVWRITDAGRDALARRTDT